MGSVGKLIHSRIRETETGTEKRKLLKAVWTWPNVDKGIPAAHAGI